MAGRVDVAVIGGGQAGLAASYELGQSGVDHVVLERGSIGSSWRGRWDSFCLVTPNWSVQLPGFNYDGPDPDGYLSRDDIVTYLTSYAATIRAPVREHVAVSALEHADGGFQLRTSDGDLHAKRVVVATGTYRRPHRPPGVDALPSDVRLVEADEYRNPDGLPEGKVLVIGSGQTGCQLAEELTRAGRDVFLSCGRAPWTRRRFGEHDAVWWAVKSGFLDVPVEALSGAEARFDANVLATGHDGGHDLHLRILRSIGVVLLGHLAGVEGRRAVFAADLGESVRWGDERYRNFVRLVRDVESREGLEPAEIPDPEPFDPSAPEELDLSGFGAVLLTGGYRPDFASWVHVPGAFDPLGFPAHREGRSDAAPDLYFLGVHFQRKRKSSLLYGVGEDAAIVADAIAG